MINGKQNVKLESGFISFKNYSRQIPTPFKIYADFECIFKNVDSSISNNDISYTKSIKIIFLVVLLIRSCVLISKKIVLYRGKNAVNKFIKSIFNEYNYCIRIIKSILTKT